MHFLCGTYNILDYCYPFLPFSVSILPSFYQPLWVVQPFHLENNQRFPNPCLYQSVRTSVCCPVSVKWIPHLPPTRFHHNRIVDRGTYCALCGVRTSTAWLAPHLCSLMEGGGPLGERNCADASEWQGCYIVTDSPLALTLLYIWCLLKQGGIKKNHRSNSFLVGRSCCIWGVMLPFFHCQHSALWKWVKE